MEKDEVIRAKKFFAAVEEHTQAMRNQMMHTQTTIELTEQGWLRVAYRQPYAGHDETMFTIGAHEGKIILYGAIMDPVRCFEYHEGEKIRKLKEKIFNGFDPKR